LLTDNVEKLVFQQQKRKGEKLLTMVFQQQKRKGEKLLTMVFQQQKRKGETIAGRCCFVNGNCEELPTVVFWQWKVADNGVSATEKKGRNNCWTVLFRQWKL
jgi:hypothetical protein